MDAVSNYTKYRGKCKEFVDAAIINDPTLKAVRGYYYDWQWGEQQHWWCVRPDGSIYDPTALQFPSAGKGDYIEFDGYFNCEGCGVRIKEEAATTYGRHVYCGGECLMRDVGL